MRPFIAALLLASCTPPAEEEGFIGRQSVTTLGGSSDVAIVDEDGLHVVLQQVTYVPRPSEKALEFDVHFVVLDGPLGENEGTVSIGDGAYTCAITEEIVECSDGVGDLLSLTRVDLPSLAPSSE